MNFTLTTISTPMTDGKISAVAGESLSAHSAARHTHCSAVNLKTAALPRMTCSFSPSVVTLSSFLSRKSCYKQRQ